MATQTNGLILSTDPNAGTPINSGGPVDTARLGTLQQLGVTPTDPTQGLQFPGGSRTFQGAGQSTSQPTGNPTDPAYIQSWLQWRATQPGSDPILQTPEGRAYYQTQILANGGLTDTNYWSNKSTLAQFGGAVGRPGGTGANFGNFQEPSLEDARNSPGYQFAFDQGQRAVQNSAAAKGTLLTGGTLKDLAQFGTGLADQTYGNVFNRALAVNSNNFGQNSTIADLGLRANQSSFPQ